jgi:hypothetical protein
MKRRIIPCESHDVSSAEVDTESGDLGQQELWASFNVPCYDERLATTATKSELIERIARVMSDRCGTAVDPAEIAVAVLWKGDPNTDPQMGPANVSDVLARPDTEIWSWAGADAGEDESPTLKSLEIRNRPCFAVLPAPATKSALKS